MSAITPKDHFITLLRPLAEVLAKVDLKDPHAQRRVGQLLPFSGGAIARVRKAGLAAVTSDWLLPKEAGGIRFGRVVKDLCGFAVDAVLMDKPGPKHRHPNGEVDLCFARSGSPRFDGNAEGWTVYGPDTTHVPTVTDGEMLIFYFLPAGAIEFAKS